MLLQIKEMFAESKKDSDAKFAELKAYIKNSRDESKTTSDGFRREKEILTEIRNEPSEKTPPANTAEIRGEHEEINARIDDLVSRIEDVETITAQNQVQIKTLSDEVESLQIRLESVESRVAANAFAASNANYRNRKESLLASNQKYHRQFLRPCNFLNQHKNISSFCAFTREKSTDCHFWWLGKAAAFPSTAKKKYGSSHLLVIIIIIFYWLILFLDQGAALLPVSMVLDFGMIHECFLAVSYVYTR